MDTLIAATALERDPTLVTSGPGISSACRGSRSCDRSAAVTAVMRYPFMSRAMLYATESPLPPRCRDGKRWHSCCHDTAVTDVGKESLRDECARTFPAGERGPSKQDAEPKPPKNGKNAPDDLSDMLEETRILLPGTQVFAGFLITLPFQSRFEINLTTAQRNLVSWSSLSRFSSRSSASSCRRRTIASRGPFIVSKGLRCSPRGW